MSSLRQCKHYRYDNGLSCAQGVSLEGKAIFVNAPCFPRNSDIPCEHRVWLTQADIDAEEAEMEKRFGEILKVRSLIVASGLTSGHIVCPECGGRLDFRVSEHNGHIHAICGTAGCIAWME